MVIKGAPRSNGLQLAGYLLNQKDNEAIRILDVNGFINPVQKDLHLALFSMSVTAELTKGDKGLYHAQINPAIGEDKAMTDDDWLQAAAILAKQLGLEEQRRVIVLHTKKSRTHAHVVWERYDHDKGRMISDSFSRMAQDRARQEMELHFGHKRTPIRNPRIKQHKATLTRLWGEATDGRAFIQMAQEHGYIIARGGSKRPFMVVDEYGRSFDLVRQLDSISTREARQRLQPLALADEKAAIEQARINAARYQAMQKTVLLKQQALQNKDLFYSYPLQLSKAHKLCHQFINNMILDQPMSFIPAVNYHP